MSSFWIRARTAVVFVAIMLAGIFGGAIPFGILFLLITLLSIAEFYRLLLPDALRSRDADVLLMISVAGLWFGLNWAAHANYIHASWTAAIIILVVLVLVNMLKCTYDKPERRLGIHAFGFVYIAFTLTLANDLVFESGTYSWRLLLGTILIVWINDSMAYVSGSMIGKTPLIPKVSPKKTIEGTIGGILFAGVGGYLLFLVFGVWTFPQWMIAGACVAFAAIVGDLIESLLKRSLGIKDSGNIMPGHGGMLDRFDALFLALPVAAVLDQVYKYFSAYPV